MEHYAGLDVSLKEISICVVDHDGKTIARGTCPADPEGVAGWFRNRSLTPRRIVHESGMLSIWLQRGMMRLGLPATCIDARKAHKVLSARLNKSDAADAEGLAQLARTGWFTPGHIRSEDADRLRSLVGARERMIRLRKDLEGHIRGVLKTFGIRMTGIGQGRQRQNFRDQLAAAGETDPVLRAIADGFITAHSTLCQAADDLDKAVKKKAKAHPVACRLMTIPGVGPVNALKRQDNRQKDPIVTSRLGHPFRNSRSCDTKTCRGQKRVKFTHSDGLAFSSIFRMIYSQTWCPSRRPH